MTLTYTDRWDSLIRYHVEREGSPLDWRWHKAQMVRESGGDPHARSPVGAMGLYQLMPATWRELAGDADPDDPDANTRAGVRYLIHLYQCFPELPDHIERTKAALAAYNGGRGYVNVALGLARAAEGQPSSHRAWRAAGAPDGAWQTWVTWSPYLRVDACRVHGQRPDAAQIIDYVARISAGYTAITA